MQEKHEIQEKYDKTAERMEQALPKIGVLHTDVSPVMKYFRQRKVSTALELAGFAKGSKILDVGSNMGQYTSLLAEKGYEMTGIDISGKSIEMAKKNADALKLGIDYYQADAEDLSLFADESFDGVVSFSVLRYVPNLDKALREIYRVTRKGGKVALDFPNSQCPWFKLMKNRFGVENHIYDHFFTSKGLRGMFEEAGFTSVEACKIMFTHYTFSPKFLGLYKFIDLVGEHTPLIRSMAAIIMCKGEKS